MNVLGEAGDLRTVVVPWQMISDGAAITAANDIPCKGAYFLPGEGKADFVEGKFLLQFETTQAGSNRACPAS